MHGRTPATAIGAGITTFLLVAVLVIELLDTEFSAIVGLPVGLLAGLAVVAVLWVSWDGMAPGVRRAASAYAAFGVMVLALLSLRYVNVGRDVLSVDVVAGAGVTAVVAVYLVLLLAGRDTS